MSFGENLKKRRQQLGISQKKLAELIGVTPRSILNYEQGSRLPQNIQIVNSIAEVLSTNADSLMNGKEEFVIQAEEVHGSIGRIQAKEILSSAEALFAGGKLDDEEMLSFMTRIQTIYLDSKKKSKKYASKK